MNAKKLILDPLESYRLGLRQSSGIIIENVDVVSAFPSPTTLLGIIGDLTNRKGSNGNRIDDLEKAYNELTHKKLKPENQKSNEPLIWGPLIPAQREGSGKFLFPLLFNKLIKDEKEYVRTAIKAAEGDYIDEKLEIIEIPATSRRMTAINRRSKTSLEGYLFYQKFFSPGYLDNQWQDLRLLYCVSVNANLKGVTHVGGENRYFRIDDKDEECDYGNGDYAILLQPLLFSTDNNDYFTKISKVNGLECVDEIYGVLVEKGNRIDFKVKVVYYGLGYGSKRRPMLQALPPGTVIKVKCKDAKALGILSELGFGSIYRVSI